MVFTRRRRKTLREEMLSSQGLLPPNAGNSRGTTRLTEEDEDSLLGSDLNLLKLQDRAARSRMIDEEFRENEANIFLSNPTGGSSFKGSFLRNKLDNPLFRQMRNRKNHTKKYKGSTLKQVQNASDLDDEDDYGDERMEKSKRRGLNLSRFTPSPKNKTKKKDNKKTRKGNFLLDTGREFMRRNTKNRLKDMKKDKINSISSTDSHISISSNVSNSSSSSNSDIELLTKYEEKSKEMKTKDNMFKLFTQNGETVYATFNTDYLQLNEQICFYEDMISWTNDRKCLRIMYIKNKDTAEQSRVEIKLYVVDKEYAGKATPYELNELLRKKVALLVCEKLQISLKDAMEMLKQQATQDDVDRAVFDVDKQGEKFLAESYTKDII